MSKLYVDGRLIDNSDYVTDTEIKTGQTLNGKPIYCTYKNFASVNWPTGQNVFELFRVANMGSNCGIRAILGGGIVLPSVDPYTVHAYVYMNISVVSGVTYGIYYLNENNVSGSATTTSLQVYAYYTKNTD